MIIMQLLQEHVSVTSMLVLHQSEVRAKRN